MQAHLRLSPPPPVPPSSSTFKHCDVVDGLCDRFESELHELKKDHLDHLRRIDRLTAMAGERVTLQDALDCLDDENTFLSAEGSRMRNEIMRLDVADSRHVHILVALLSCFDVYNREVVPRHVRQSRVAQPSGVPRSWPR